MRKYERRFGVLARIETSNKNDEYLPGSSSLAGFDLKQISTNAGCQDYFMIFLDFGL